MAAELALGAISVAGLFNNALECFQLVRIGQNFERDIEIYQTMLNLLALRLSQWGEAVGINKNDTSFFSDVDTATARNTLQKILDLFDKVREKSESDFNKSMRAVCGKIR
jgi:hypothetical protein